MMPRGMQTVFLLRKHKKIKEGTDLSLLFCFKEKTMTVKEAIDRADHIKPNTYETNIKITWLNDLDLQILDEVIFTHEGFEKYIDRKPYTQEDTNVQLIAEAPYDELYVQYLVCMIDKYNEETQKYNNSALLFNSYLDNFEKHYNKIHEPINRLRWNNWRSLR